ncbi:hypothetical protein DV737_g4757, partial [Chaetothyriales sp. CBS 132003]
MLLEVAALRYNGIYKHRNIVELLGYGVEIDSWHQAPFLVMELADSDFSKFLETQRSWEVLQQLCLDVGSGLDLIHTYGLVHGDLKPLNVLVFPAPQHVSYVAKLADFGFSTGDVNALQGGTVKLSDCSHGWAAPEVEQHLRQGTRITVDELLAADMFAYGLLIYSAFCNGGKMLPSGAFESKEKLQQLTSGVPRLLRETVIMTASSLLQNDFALRPREVGELLADDSEACVKRLQAWREYEQLVPQHFKSRDYYSWELPSLSAFFVDDIDRTFRNSKADLTGPALLAMYLYKSFHDATKQDKSLQVEMLLESARKGHPPAQGIAQTVLRSYGLPISQYLSNEEQDKWLFCAASTGSRLALRELTVLNPKLAEAASDHFRNNSGYGQHSILFAEGSHSELKLGTGDCYIHDCAKGGELDDLKSLLDRTPQDINARNSMHETPLYKACMAGHYQVVLELCKRGAAAGLTHTDYEISCLHWLFNFPPRDINLVLRALIDAGASVNHSLATTRPLFNPHFPFTWPPGTALHWAVATSSQPAISALLNAAADPTIRNGDDPYICDGNVRQMHRHGNIEQGEYSATPEHVLGMTSVDLATAAHDWQSLYAISPLAAGKNPSLLSVDEEGYTPFHRLSYQRIGRTFSGSRFWYPALKGDFKTRRRNLQKTIEWLQAVGGDINQLTNTPAKPGLSGVDGLSPLMIAVTKYDVEAVEALCNAGANVNLQNRSGRTALTLLHDALAYHVNPSGVLPDMVACLVRHKADVNYQSSDGLTPLSCLAGVGDIGAFRCLLQAGADIKCQDQNVAVLADLIQMNATNKLVLERVDVHQIEQKDEELSVLLRDYINDGALDVDFVVDKTGATILHYCVAAALPSCTSTLLSMGAATNIIRTALPQEQRTVEFFLRDSLIMGTPKEIISKQMESFLAKRNNRLNAGGVRTGQDHPRPRNMQTIVDLTLGIETETWPRVGRPADVDRRAETGHANDEAEAEITMTGDPFKRSKGPLPSQKDAFQNNDLAVTKHDSNSEKQKPNYGNTGRLAAASNTVQKAGQSIVLKYHEPSEARKPSGEARWRMYVFKGDAIVDTIELAQQSYWLFGREAAVVDVLLEHPSTSKQHAVIQFRYIEKQNEFGDRKGRVRPYILDLESANGTTVNEDLIPEAKYVELRDQDVSIWGQQFRRYSTGADQSPIRVQSYPAPHSGSIRVLLLNKPETRNALSRRLVADLSRQVDELAAEDGRGGTRVLVIASNADKAFCAGADLKERKGMSQEETQAFLRDLRQVLANLSQLPIPTISAISSVALGGGLELGLCTTFRVFGSTVTIGLPETRLAIIPGAGGTYRLPALIGPGRARDLILTGRRVSGPEAYFLGLCDRLVEITPEEEKQEGAANAKVLDKAIDDLPVLDDALRLTDEETYDKTANAIVARLAKLDAQDLVSKDALERLHPSTHTIAYVIALNAIIDQAIASGKAAPRQLPAALLPDGSLWPYLSQILVEFDAIQVRYAGSSLLKIVDVVARGAEQTRNIVPAIQLLHNVILRLDPTSSTLTSTHRIYVRLCLLAGAYNEGIDIVERPIYHIPAAGDRPTSIRPYSYICQSHETSATYLAPTTGLTLKITSRGYLEYYIWGALCYIAVGQYEKALPLLKIVVLAPTQQQVASLIQVEAYKKWVLLNLLLYGQVREIKGAQATTLRNIRAVAKVYDCVAGAFRSRDVRRLQAEIAEAGDVWEADMNYGLIVEVFRAHRRFAVINLDKTYTALPVSDVARHTSPEPGNVSETVSYLGSLIQSGHLKATLTASKDGSDQILRFLAARERHKPEMEVEQELAVKAQQLQNLLRNIGHLEHRTELSTEYIDYLRKLKKTRDEDNKKDSGGGTKSKNAAVDEFEEDMMEDMVVTSLQKDTKHKVHKNMTDDGLALMSPAGHAAQPQTSPATAAVDVAMAAEVPETPPFWI